jgi:hypothetical protein
MRELTKSTLSAGLAMSLFGLQTMINMVRQQRFADAKPAQEPLDRVTQALVDNTGSMLRETFAAGDKLQRRMVDLTFRLLTMGSMRDGMPNMSDAAQRASERMRSWMGDSSGAKPGGCGCSDSGSPSGPDGSASMRGSNMAGAGQGRGRAANQT